MSFPLASRLKLATLPVVLAVGVAVAASPAQQQAAPAAPTRGLTLNGHFIDHVLVDGQRLVSYAEYRDVVEAKALADNTFLEMHFDPASVDRGHFVAFSSESASRAFMKAGGLPAVESTGAGVAKGEALRTQAAARPQRTLNGKPISLVTCYPYSYNQALLYDGLNCTDASIGMWTQDKIPNLGTYGWNDRPSSALAGTCIYYLKMFRDINYLGTSQILWGPNQYLQGLTLGNEVSSATTPGTRC